MLTRLEFRPPEKGATWEATYDALVKALSEHLRELNKPNGLEIGAAAITADQGIKFPATWVPLTDPNTFDDYEKNDWTPSDTSGAGLVFTAPTGHYRKFGDMVICWGTLQYPVTASGANAKIGGLPFTVKNTAASRGFGVVGFCTDATITSVLVTNNTTEMQVIAGAGVATNAVMSNDTIYFCVAYPVA